LGRGIDRAEKVGHKVILRVFRNLWTVSRGF
jgi:hypothetical protein